MTIPQYPLAPGRVAIHDPAIVEDRGTYYTSAPTAVAPAAPTWCTGSGSRTT